jgi:hypothetical protein
MNANGSLVSARVLGILTEENNYLKINLDETSLIFFFMSQPFWMKPQQ